MFKAVCRYIISNKIASIVILYFIVSVILKMATAIDVCIPCLWKTIFGLNCPGCGLTRAFIELMQMNIYKAYSTNPLIFVVLPSVLFIIIRDFVNFSTKIER